MIIEIPDDNSIVKWKMNDNDEWKSIEIIDLIKMYEERPKGEWIKEPNGKTTDIYRCSICGRSILLCKNADMSKYPFCHCGADMRGDTE